jgi:hypothetical protein
VQVGARPRDSVVGRNSFGHGPRAEPGLVEQVHLMRTWNAELGRGKKKDVEVEPPGANRRRGVVFKHDLIGENG